ncbi:MAG: hypothetical protein QNJ73_04970 [Gammaproteobacteria bacterium]|nr:hypothetical protein [Gammaproteobacteria bacterium]
MKMNSKQLFAVFAAFGLAGFAPPAVAYLDPSTGSMILSAIVGLFATVALALKTYWYRLKAFFRGDRRQQKSPDEQTEPASGDPSPER